ncbi:MAG: chorismate synthase [Candidatus Delongbacteria bacterium]|jgi:chorismate synthase|nr:chorismate synthase [Candidatus Delongbacteria bacterium]
MNTFGNKFKIIINGTSHGEKVGIDIVGCPSGIPISLDDFTDDLLKRKSGAPGTTKRIESDIPNIISGIYQGQTTGAIISIDFDNKDAQSKDYDKFSDIPRPGHADFTNKVKYKGERDHAGGGQSSGRMTLPLVAAGVIAKKIIPEVKFFTRLIEVGGSTEFDKVINEIIEENDSVGGIIECRISNISVGFGEPFFDSVESMISHIIFSIPGIKGIEFGAGFEVAKMKGSECNDVFIDEQGTTATNNSGGINGGISNGNEIVFRVAVKPTSSIGKGQRTFNFKTKEMTDLVIEGRHDVCFALRTPIIVENAAAIVLADLFLRK